MLFPLELRQRYLQHGFVVVPRSLVFASSTALDPPSVSVGNDSAQQMRMVDQIRAKLLDETERRFDEFYRLPTLETILKNTAKISDPVYAKMQQRMLDYKRNMQRRRAAKRRLTALRRQQQQLNEAGTTSSRSAEDIWKLTQAVMEELKRQQSPDACRSSTIDNDPQLLRAIREHRVNTWMTSPALEHVVRHDFGKRLGQLATEVGGVEEPVLFSDRPLVRPSYGRPFAFHCDAPSIGVDPATAATPPNASVSVLLFTHDVSPAAMQVFAIRESHRLVRDHLWGLKSPPPCDPKSLRVRFAPMESHMPDFFAKAPGLPWDDTVHVSAPVCGIEAGDVLVADTNLLVALGPNLVHEANVVWRWSIVGAASLPSFATDSWINTWRSSPKQIRFDAPSVFPPLY